MVNKNIELSTISITDKIIHSPTSAYPTPSAEIALSDRIASLKFSSKMLLSIPSYRRRIESFKILLPPSAYKRLDSLTALPRTHRLRYQFMLAIALVSEIAEALGQFLALPNKPIVTGPDAIVDSISSCPGVSFQRAILGGLLIEQSFVPALWRAGGKEDGPQTKAGAKIEDDLPLLGWADDCAAGLVLDKSEYTASKNGTVLYQEAEKRQVGEVRDMVLLKSEWIRSWFKDENWEMLDWGKLSFYEGQFGRKSKFWKMRTGGQWKSLRGFVVFPAK